VLLLVGLRSAGSDEADGLARGASARGRVATAIGAPALLGIVVLATWQYLVQSGRVSPFLLPYPGAVMRSLWDSLTLGSLGGYVAPTMVEALSGYAVGAACALPLGYGIAHSRLVASTLQPPDHAGDQLHRQAGGLAVDVRASLRPASRSRPLLPEPAAVEAAQVRGQRRERAGRDASIPQCRPVYSIERQLDHYAINICITNRPEADRR
jgi:hypothetical protein